MKSLIALIAVSTMAFSNLANACDEHAGHGGHGGHHGGTPTTPAPKPSNPDCSIEFKSLMTCAKVEFAKAPNTNEESTFTIALTSHHPVQIKDVKVVLWMDMGNGHGHGSAPVELTKIDDTHYTVKNAWFVMIGEWQVKVQIETADGVEEAILPVIIHE